MIKFVNKKAPDHDRVRELLQLSQQTGQYTNEGPVKSLLEKKLHSLLEIEEDKAVYCCNSGTSAIYISMYLAEKSMGRRMKWCVPSFTFPSCINGQMFDVDVLDVDPCTGTLRTEQCLDYDGIVLTNLFGTVVNIEDWESFAKSKGKRLIFDNAASALTKYMGSNVCNYGDYSIGSLHHTKYLGFGEGGFLVLPQEEYTSAQRISAFGFGTYEEDFRRAHIYASNFKMPDPTAAYILQHIESFSIQDYVKLQDLVIERLESAGFSIFYGCDRAKTDIVFANAPCLLDKETCMDDLANLSVELKKYYYPLFPANKNAFQLYNKIINVPFDEDIDLLLRVLAGI
jgi:dTDP-4-amino-4,6-dideoxygalactose transaminase